MAKCGKCGKDGATVAEIKRCYGVVPGVHDGEVVLEVTADDGEQEVTVRLTPGHVRDLRLVLQRCEKEMRS